MNKYRFTFLLMAFVFLCFAKLSAQSTRVLSAGGENKTKDSFSLSWTIGEPVIATRESGDLMISSGFHQSFKIDSIIHMPNFPVYMVYPNPTISRIYLRADQVPKDPFYIALFNSEGKIILQDRMEGIEYTTDLSTFSAGIYFITLARKKNEKAKTYKIIKY